MVPRDNSTIVIGIGLPASGKTTVLEPLAASMSAGYVCVDNIRRELLTAKAKEGLTEATVEKLFYIQIRQQMCRRNKVVVDASNCNAANRLHLVQYCRLLANRVEGFMVTTSLDECLRRNSARSIKAPRAKIIRMAQILELNGPTVQEGFDLITLTS